MADWEVTSEEVYYTEAMMRILADEFNKLQKEERTA